MTIKAIMNLKKKIFWPLLHLHDFVSVHVYFGNHPCFEKVICYIKHCSIKDNFVVFPFFLQIFVLQLKLYSFSSNLLKHFSYLSFIFAFGPCSFSIFSWLTLSLLVLPWTALSTSIPLCSS